MLNQKGIAHLVLLILLAASLLTYLTVWPKIKDNLFQQPSTVKAATAYSPKILLLIYNPIIESQAGQKLTTVKNWNDPDQLSQTLINDFNAASGGKVSYSIASRTEIDGIPLKADGFQYTDDTYLACTSNSSNCHSPDGAGYVKMLESVDACGKRNRGEIDEVWIWGGPYFGYWESNLAGPNAFWYNSGPTTGTTCQKLLPIMGFNYERGEAEALESYGHRTESTMINVYGSWDKQFTHNWNKFSLLDVDLPGKGGCGNAHLAVNASSNTGYDRENTRTVSSDCDDFQNYPNLTGTFKDTSCTAWGCTTAGYLKWWYAHLPKADGVGLDGKLNNWWAYIVDPQGTIIAPPAGTFSNLSSMLNLSSASFNFAYSGTSSNYKVDLSAFADMSWDVYLDFGQGANSPVVENNPTKWDKYQCGKILYWRVYNSDRSVQSPIQIAQVNCNTPTPTPTSTPTSTPTATPTPAPTPDTTPPAVTITSPVNGSTVAKNTTVTIKASASDASGVSKVEFYVDNILICTSSTSPYSCNWKVPAKTRVTYTIQAKAYDKVNNTTTTTVKVTSK